MHSFGERAGGGSVEREETQACTSEKLAEDLRADQRASFIKPRSVIS